MIKIEIDKAQYDMLKTQTQSLYTHWNIPLESRYLCTPCYKIEDDMFVLAGWEHLDEEKIRMFDEDDDFFQLRACRANGPEPVVQYFARIKLGKNERLEDFAEFEDKKVAVRYRFKAHSNGRDKGFYLRMTDIRMNEN